jgi:hypothetical protein
VPGLLDSGSFHALGFQESAVPEAGFPRLSIGENSPHCVRTAAPDGHDYYRSLPAPILGSVSLFQYKRSVLPSLGLAAVCSAGRILMNESYSEEPPALA